MQVFEFRKKEKSISIFISLTIDENLDFHWSEEKEDSFGRELIILTGKASRSGNSLLLVSTTKYIQSSYITDLHAQESFLEVEHRIELPISGNTFLYEQNGECFILNLKSE